MPVADLDPAAERLLEASRTRETVHPRGRERTTRWLFAVAFLAVAVPLAELAPRARSPSPLLVTFLICGYALATRVRFEVGAGFTDGSELLFVPMLFLMPAGLVPLAVTMGLLLGQLPEYARGAPLERAASVVGNAWYSLGPALVFLAFGQPSAHFDGWAVLGVAVIAQYVVDAAVSVSSERLALQIPPRALIRPLLWVFGIDTLLAPVGLAAAVGSLSTHAALLLTLPLLGLMSLFAAERRRRIDHALELSAAYRGTAFVLADVIEADDHYTGSHSRQVLDLVVDVCEELGLDARQRLRGEFAALLHDVGKIKIPADVINKPGPLTDEERSIMQMHTVEGERLLLPVGGLLAEIGRIVRFSHEHYDGNGYPDGLAGEAIPLIARIVSCCDAFNAMVTERPYGRRRSTEEALDELVSRRGTQFDPSVVDALVRIVGRRRTGSGSTALTSGLQASS